MALTSKRIGIVFGAIGVLFSVTTTYMIALVGSLRPNYPVTKLYETAEFGIGAAAVFFYHSAKRLWPRGSAGTILRTDTPWRAFEDLGVFLFALIVPSVLVLFIGVSTAVELRKVISGSILEIFTTVTIPLINYLLFPTAALSLLYSRRLAQPSASFALDASSRSPIVLLRAFRDDAQVFPRGVALKQQPYWRKLLGLRFEYVIAVATSPLATLIALGSPRETTPQEGAFRDRAGNRWRERVMTLISRASYAIVIVDGSEHLAWEVREILKVSGCSKLILLLPPVSPEEKRSRWERFVAATEMERYMWLPDPQQIATAICVNFPKQPGQYTIVTRDAPRAQDYVEAIKQALHFHTEESPSDLPMRELHIDASPETVGTEEATHQTTTPRLYSTNQIVVAAFLQPLAGLTLKLINDLKLKRYGAFARSLLAIGVPLGLAFAANVKAGAAHPSVRVVVELVAGLELVALWFVVRYSYDVVYQRALLEGIRRRSTVSAVLIWFVVCGILAVLS
jgi:hypothetical protein